MFSNKVLKRFVKDYSLPIQVIQEPYFNYFMELYNQQYKTKDKYSLLEQAVSQFNSEEEFLNHYYVIRDKMIKEVESTEAYKEFNSMKIDRFNVPNLGYPSRDIFNMSNVGKYFISIDLVKANFQALKWFNRDLVLNCDTYGELIGRFADLEYMKNSKYLRQVVFGNMNPKRQVKIERYMTQKILEWLLDNHIFKESQIRMVSNDEIVFEISKEISCNLNTNELISFIKQNLDFEVDIEVYKLKNIEGSTKYFSKEFINKDGYELMCVPLVYHAQIFKRYNHIEINENDLVFFYENQVCKFINPLDFESEDTNDECSRNEE